MSFRSGKADRQFPPGVFIAEEHLGNRAARLLADIPALQDRIGLLLQQADIERPSVEESDDHRLPGFLHRTEELLLLSNHLKGWAVTHMVQRDRKSTRLNSSHV